MSEKSQSTVVERYRQLVKALQELASILNTELLLEYIVQAAAELCDAEAAWILLPDQINHVLYLETGYFTKDKQFQGLSVPMDTSLEGWVISNQQTVMINDSSDDHSLGDLISLPGIEINSILAVPLTTRSKRIGVLEVSNKHSGDYSQLDQEILVSFANLAAICIDNSHRAFQSDLVTELVHELHTPLTALNTALYLLQRSDLPGTKREQISEMVQNEFNRLTDLTTSFLDYARLESGKVKFAPTQFDLSQLIRESVEIMRMQVSGKGLKITLDIPAKPLLLNADKDKIKQVVLNLINNAIKYSRTGGIIHITASSNPTGISFSVQDNGQGIPPEFLPRLFERFFRSPTMERGSTGTGLGLTICKQIVEAHKGSIEVSSTVGKGSTFTIRLPLNREI